MTEEEWNAYVYRIKEKIESCDRQIKKLNKELSDCENDFAILENQEIGGVVPLIRLLEDLSLLISALNTSMNNYSNHMDYLKNVGDIINTSVLNISEFQRENANFSTLKSDIESSCARLKTLANGIDDVKTQIAKRVKELKLELAIKEDERRKLRSYI